MSARSFQGEMQPAGGLMAPAFEPAGQRVSPGMAHRSRLPRAERRGLRLQGFEVSDPILGWKLDPHGRAALLARFAPAYPQTVADHVTFGREAKAPGLPEADKAIVIGRADDGRGVEALVVEVGGTASRWDGGTYHITWSLAEGREAKESNDVIARFGWQPVGGRPSVSLSPAVWP